MKSILINKLTTKQENIENGKLNLFENDILSTTALKQIKGGGGEDDSSDEDEIIYPV